MPSLYFYGNTDDVVAILGFALGGCRVFESHSVPDKPLRIFSSSADLGIALQEQEQLGVGLMLYAPSMLGDYAVERFELKSGAIKGKSWRERIVGWGLIQVHFAGFRGSTLKPSSTSHNSEKRARLWSQTCKELPPVEGWDFTEVTRISRRINRYITNQAVGREGTRLILPGAHRLVVEGTVKLGAA